MANGPLVRYSNVERCAVLALDHAPVNSLSLGLRRDLAAALTRAAFDDQAQAIVLIGQMTEKLFAAWNSAVPCGRAATLADAVEQSRQLAKPGDVVLFSPGCSSFDMFRDFEDRGDQFRALIQVAAKQT